MRATIIAIALVVLFGLACSGNQKLKVLRTAFVSVDAAKAGLEPLDRAYQVSLIDKAKTREEALARVQQYRDQRAPLIEAFVVAYRVLGVAALDPNDANYLEALKMVKELLESVKKFKETLQQGPPDKKPPPTIDLSPGPEGNV